MEEYANFFLSKKGLFVGKNIQIKFKNNMDYF